MSPASVLGQKKTLTGVRVSVAVIISVYSFGSSFTFRLGMDGQVSIKPLNTHFFKHGLG